MRFWMSMPSPASVMSNPRGLLDCICNIDQTWQSTLVISAYGFEICSTHCLDCGVGFVVERGDGVVVEWVEIDD